MMILLFSLQSLFSQQQLSLQEAILIGLNNNYQIRICQNDVIVAENNNAWGTAGLFPSVTLGANQVNRFDNQPDFQVPGTRDKIYTNNIAPYVNVRWNLFSAFNVRINKQKLELLEGLTEGFSALMVENTVQAIILAYYNALLQKETDSVLKEVKKLSRDRYEYVLFRKELGSAVTYDVLQAKNAYFEDSTNYLLQQLNVRNAMLNLRLLLGEENTETEYILTDRFRIVNQEFSLDSLSKQMFAHNKTLINQYLNQEILKKEVAFQKSYLYPTLSLNAGFDHFNTRTQYEGNDPAYSYNLDYYANLSLSFNLSNGGNVRRAIRNANIEQETGELEIQELKLVLGNQLTNYYELYKIRKQLYDVSEVNLESARLNLEISTDKFRSGAINSFNFRDVQVIYLRAAFQRLKAIYNLIDTHTEILRITGGIIAEY
ncbi:MAG: TolC family protein [Bacteroidetes bacterium]|nr:TolC family protein [Bacteroidota bacterium]